MPKRTLPPGVEPHNGRELELMLQGDKPMALFAAEPGMDAEDVGDAECKPFVEEGRILKFTQIVLKTSVEERRYCLPTEEWRCKYVDLQNVSQRRGLRRLHIELKRSSHTLHR